MKMYGIKKIVCLGGYPVFLDNEQKNVLKNIFLSVDSENMSFDRNQEKTFQRIAKSRRQENRLLMS
jgi:hypothetical protein